MNTLDFFLLIPIVIGFVFGVFKGLIKELTSLAAIVLGVYGAKLLAPNAYRILISTFGVSETIAKPLSYFILFILIVIGMLMLAKMLDKVFDSMALGGLNKMLGGIFGALKYAIIVSVLLNVFNAVDSRFSLLNRETKETSIGYKPLTNLAPELWDKTHSENSRKEMKLKHEEKKQ